MSRRAASTLDYRALARRRLPHFLFEYFDGGSYGEVTLKRNVDDLAAIALRQRVLTDVSNIDLSAELLGQRLPMPVALGPIGLAGLAARRGEVQAARAAEESGGALLPLDRLGLHARRGRARNPPRPSGSSST